MFNHSRTRFASVALATLLAMIAGLLAMAAPPARADGVDLA